MRFEATVQPQSEAAFSPISLAGVVFEPGDNIDHVFAGLAQDLGNKGWVVAGLVQEEAPHDSGSCCPATFVRDLTDGTRAKISVDRGANATGCRLDAHALSEAVARVDAALEGGADILIVNRFGQSESDGGGLRATIERGIERRLPVVVAVRRTYAVPWREFHGGLATSLAFDQSAIANWAATALDHERIHGVEHA